MPEQTNQKIEEKAADFRSESYKLRTQTTIYDKSGTAFTVSELAAEKLLETGEWLRVKPPTEAEKTNTEIRGLRSDFAQFTAKNDEQNDGQNT